MSENSDSAAPDPPRWWNRTVIGAGLTSALGDLCYETTTVILLGFLAFLPFLVFQSALLGLIEGVTDATVSYTKMVAGFIAEKIGQRKMLAFVGYALTPVGQILIVLALGVDRSHGSWFGKGLRGPLRDAIVIQSMLRLVRLWRK
jgi:hypothetical protein